MAMFTNVNSNLVRKARRELSEPSDLSARIRRASGGAGYHSILLSTRKVMVNLSTVLTRPTMIVTDDR